MGGAVRESGYGEAFAFCTISLAQIIPRGVIEWIMNWKGCE
jgi:hypothetical protein